MAEKSKTPDPPANNAPELTKLSKRLVELMNWCQSEDVSISKAVREFRKLFDTISDSRERKNFIRNLTFMVQIPLVNGTSKERPNKFDEKLFEVVCRFSSSFVDDAIKRREEVGEDDADTEVPWIMRKLFIWLLDRHEISSSCARLRICMLINWLLKHLGNSFEIDETMYKKIYVNMSERMKDKVAEIRAQAVTALHRLQNPRDAECPVIKAYLFHLGYDPSALVRKTVIKNIGSSKYILAFIIRRISDIDEAVRVAAFKFLAEKVHMRSLTISCREDILKKGLSDSSKTVNKIVTKDLIQTWLTQCKGNIIDFLFALDVRCSDGDGKTAGQCLNALFTDVPYNQLIENFTVIDPATKLIPASNLSPEAVVYWKNLVHFLHNEAQVKGIEEAEAHLDKLLPELSDFCVYIRNYFVDICKKREDEDADAPMDEKTVMDDLNSAFVGRNLIEMTSFFDLSDEAGRRNLLKVCKKLLANRNVSIGYVEVIMKIYNKVQVKAETRIMEIAEIISDLRDPLITTTQKETLETQQVDDEKEEEMIKKANNDLKLKEDRLRQKQFELAKMRVTLNELKDSMEKAIANQEFILAQTLKLEADRVTAEQIKLHDEIQQEKALTIVEVSEPEPKLDVADEPFVAQTQTYRDDPNVVLKCLAIISELLRPKDITKMSPILRTLLDEFVVPAVSNVSLKIRDAAVKAIGCLTLRDPKAARKHLLLVIQISLMDECTVRMTAIKVIVDLLMFHGSSPFIVDEDETNLNKSEEDLFEEEENPLKPGQLTQASLTIETVIASLVQLLDEDENEDIRTLIIEGLCKLMLSALISSPRLISRFVIMWSNPIVERNSMVFHVLAAFLQLYPSLSSDNQEIVHESFMITMRMLVGAPLSSPLSQISLDSVGMFYLDLTRPGYLQEKAGNNQHSSNVHDDLALTIANEILKNPDTILTKPFVKLLLNLQLTPTNFSYLRDLRSLNRQIMEVISHDKTLNKSLEKFGDRLDDWIKNDPVTNPADQEDQSNEDLEHTETELSNIENKESKEKTPKDKRERKRTLYTENADERFDISSDESSQNQDTVFTSTQKDDIESATTSSTSQSTNKDDNLFLSPSMPAPRSNVGKKKVVTKKMSSSDEDNDNAELNRVEESGSDPESSFGGADLERIPESEEEDEKSPSARVPSDSEDDFETPKAAPKGRRFLQIPSSLDSDDTNSSTRSVRRSKTSSTSSSVKMSTMPRGKDTKVGTAEGGLRGRKTTSSSSSSSMLATSADAPVEKADRSLRGRKTTSSSSSSSLFASGSVKSPVRGSTRKKVPQPSSSRSSGRSSRTQSSSSQSKSDPKDVASSQDIFADSENGSDSEQIVSQKVVKTGSKRPVRKLITHVNESSQSSVESNRRSSTRRSKTSSSASTSGLEPRTAGEDLSQSPAPSPLKRRKRN